MAEKWCVTDLSMDTVELEWTIENFLSFSTDTIESSIFTHNGVQWRMQSYHKNVSLGKGGTIDTRYLSLAAVSSIHESPMSVTFKFTVEGDQQEKLTLAQSTHKTVLLNYYYYASQGISNIEKYLSNGFLRIKCEINIVSNQKHFHYDSSSVKIPTCDLKSNFITLFRDQSLSDVTLVAGGKEFKAHKLILSARSPVFAGMFKHGMSESISNQVTIEDISSVTMEQLLVYIYSGDAPVFSPTNEPLKTTPVESDTDSSTTEDDTISERYDRDEIIQQLLSAADKYQIDRLKACCESAMNKAVTVDNAADTLLFADMHNAAQLKRSCTAFIASYRSKVLTTPGWSKLAERHDLLLSILQATV